nr:hypothetical protein CFP56_36349 [Quercus suber]
MLLGLRRLRRSNYLAHRLHSHFVDLQLPGLQDKHGALYPLLAYRSCRRLAVTLRRFISVGWTRLFSDKVNVGIPEQLNHKLSQVLDKVPLSIPYIIGL